MKRFLSVILAAAMVFAMALPASAVQFKVSAPTPERAWCVTQNQYCDWDGHLMERGYNYIELPDQPTYYRTLSYYVEKDGTFTEAGRNKISEYIMENMMNPEDVTFDVIDGMEIPGNIYDYLRFELEVFIRTIKLFADMPEAEALGLAESIAAFLADYPDSDTLYSEIMETYFGGNETPAVTEMIAFLYGDQIKLIPYGVDDYHVMYYYDEYITDEEDWFINISEIVAPNGAYYNTSLTEHKGTNVYNNLEVMIESGWMADPWFSFSLITGYATDNEGYLYTRAPEYVYALDAQGNRVKDFSALIDVDGKVVTCGMELYDMAVEALVETYKLIYGDVFDILDYTDIPEVDYGELDRYMDGLIAKYFDVQSEDGDTVMSEEEMRAMAEAEIDGYIAETKESGADDDAVTAMLFYTSGYSVDEYGYVYEDVEYGYVTDGEGNRIHADDVMDDDGNLLIGEYAGRSTASVLLDFMEGIDSSALLKGDVNADGRINLSDASAMMKKIAKWDIELHETPADVSGDGKTNLSDVSLVLQYIAGWDVEFAY